MRLSAVGAMLPPRLPREEREVTGVSAGEDRGRSGTYRAGAAVAVVTSLLTVWTTVVRDDGNGFGFFMLVMAAVVGAFSAWFRAAGLARAMVGVAVMQALLGIAIATAPVTANVPGGPA